MNKGRAVLISMLMFSVGMILGFLISPIKRGIGNDSGNTTNNYYNKEETE